MTVEQAIKLMEMLLKCVYEGIFTPVEAKCYILSLLRAWVPTGDAFDVIFNNTFKELKGE